MEDREKTGDIIGSQREAGVGEEGLHAQEGRCDPCEIEIQAKRRGEAEGGQKERHKWDKDGEPKEEQAVMTESSEIPKHPMEDHSEVKDTNPAVFALSGPDVKLLTKQLQEAQEEVDRQVELAQNLRSKLAEQSRKTWEAEQKLVLSESELQRLKKAAESLLEARRQIEVRMRRKKTPCSWNSRSFIRQIKCQKDGFQKYIHLLKI